MKIENTRYEVTFDEKGGEILSFSDKQNNLQYMYQGNTPYWSGKNPTLFPIVGNTFDGTYKAKGKTYTFKNHGLIRYSVLKCIDHSDTSITFELKANEETLLHYPYLFTYHVIYTLEDNTLTVRYEITNHDEEVMPFTFGLHPGFKAPLSVNEKYEDYKICFEDWEEMEQLIFDDKKLIPHHYEPVAMKELNLDYELMKKYSTLIYRGYKSSSLTLQGVEGHGVKVGFKGFPLLALWSPVDAPFICIEPWYSHGDFEENDKAFEDRIGMMSLKPEETFTTSYTISVF